MAHYSSGEPDASQRELPFAFTGRYLVFGDGDGALYKELSGALDDPSGS